MQRKLWRKEFSYWQTCGKGLFRIFYFLKIVKIEHELLKECFQLQIEEPKPVSVKNINRKGRVLTGNILYLICFLFPIIICIRTKLKYHIAASLCL